MHQSTLRYVKILVFELPYGSYTLSTQTHFDKTHLHFCNAFLLLPSTFLIDNDAVVSSSII
jgi:hypothetical protein